MIDNTVGDNDLGFVRPSVRLSIRDLSVRINISNTNKYFFSILYTCIYFNPPMNPIKFHPDKIQNGRPIAIFVCSNWQNIWKLVDYPTNAGLIFLKDFKFLYENFNWQKKLEIARYISHLSNCFCACAQNNAFP